MIAVTLAPALVAAVEEHARRAGTSRSRALESAAWRGLARISAATDGRQRRKRPVRERGETR